MENNRNIPTVTIKTKEIERHSIWRNVMPDENILNTHSLNNEKDELNQLNSRLELLLRLLKQKIEENDYLQSQIDLYKTSIHKSSEILNKSKVGVDLKDSRSTLNELSNHLSLNKIRLARSMYDVDQLKDKLSDEININEMNKSKIEKLEIEQVETENVLNELKNHFSYKEGLISQNVEKLWSLRNDYTGFHDELDRSLEKRAEIESNIQSLVEQRNFEVDIFKIMKSELKKLFLIDTNGKKIFDIENFYLSELKNIKDKIRDDFFKLNDFNSESIREEYEKKYTTYIEKYFANPAPASDALNEQNEIDEKNMQDEYQRNKDELKQLKSEEYRLRKLYDELLLRKRDSHGKYEFEINKRVTEIAYLEEQIQSIKNDSWNLLNFSKTLDAEVAIYSRLLNERFGKYLLEQTNEKPTFSFDKYKEAIYGNLLPEESEVNKNVPQKTDNLILPPHKPLIYDIGEKYVLPQREKKNFQHDQTNFVDLELRELQKQEELKEARRKEMAKQDELERQNRLREQRELEEKQRLEREKRLREEELKNEARRAERAKREEQERQNQIREEREREIERQKRIKEQKDFEEKQRVEREKLQKEDELNEARRKEKARLDEQERLNRLKEQKDLEEKQRLEREKRLKEEEEERKRRQLQIEKDEAEYFKRLHEENERKLAREYELKKKLEEEERARLEAERLNKIKEQEEKEREKNNKRTGKIVIETQPNENSLEINNKHINQKQKYTFEQRFQFELAEIERLRRLQAEEKSDHERKNSESNSNSKSDSTDQTIAYYLPKNDDGKGLQKGTTVEIKNQNTNTTQVKILDDSKDKEIGTIHHTKIVKPVVVIEREDNFYVKSNDKDVQIKKKLPIENGNKKKLDSSSDESKEISLSKNLENELSEYEKRFQREQEEIRNRQLRIEEQNRIKMYELEIKKRQQLEDERREREKREYELKMKQLQEINMLKQVEIEKEQKALREKEEQIRVRQAEEEKRKEIERFEFERRVRYELEQIEIEKRRIIEIEQQKLEAERYEYQRRVEYEERKKREDEDARLRALESEEQERLRLLELEKQRQLQRDREEYERRILFERKQLEYEKHIIQQQDEIERLRKLRQENTVLPITHQGNQLHIVNEPQNLVKIVEVLTPIVQQQEQKNITTQKTVEVIKEKRTNFVETIVDHCVSSNSGRKHVLLVDGDMKTIGGSYNKSLNNSNDKLSKHALKHKANRYVSGAIGILETSTNGEYIVLENLSSTKTVNLNGWYLQRYVPDQNLNVVFKFPTDVWINSGEKLRVWSRLSVMSVFPNDNIANIIADNVDNWGIYSKYSVTKLINQEGIDKAILTQTLLRLYTSTNNINSIEPLNHETVELKNVQTSTTTTTSSRMNQISYQQPTNVVI